MCGSVADATSRGKVGRGLRPALRASGGGFAPPFCRISMEMPSGERTKAMEMYESLSHEQREKVPQTLRVWLRYRSAKDFGEHRTPPQKCVNA